MCGKSLPSPDALFLPGQMHGAGAAGRMRGEVVGRDIVRRRCGERRVLRDRRLLRRDVVQNRRQPALDFADRHLLPRRIVLDLVTLDLADAEIEAPWMTEVEAAHGTARPHRKALG